MPNHEEYLPPLGRRRSRKVEIYSKLDSLWVGGTCEFRPRKRPRRETERTMHGIVSYWQLMRDRKVRFHTTSRGFMFVRIE